MVSTPTGGLIARDARGAAHPPKRASDGTTPRCPQCGSDALTERRDHSPP